MADITKKVPIYVHFVEKLQTFDLRALGGSFAERGFKIGHRHCGTTTRAIKTAPFN